MSNFTGTTVLLGPIHHFIQFHNLLTPITFKYFTFPVFFLLIYQISYHMKQNFQFSYQFPIVYIEFGFNYFSFVKLANIFYNFPTQWYRGFIRTVLTHMGCLAGSIPPGEAILASVWDLFQVSIVRNWSSY